MLSKRIEERVRRRIVALPGAADRRGKRGEQYEPREIEVSCQLVQVERRLYLWPHHTLHLLSSQRLHDAIVECSRRVDHRSERVLAWNRVDQRRELLTIGDVALRDPRLRAELRERTDELLDPLGLRTATAHQQQPPSAVP